MNLGNYMDEGTPKVGSLVDHSWWTEGLVKQDHPFFSPHELGGHADNNIKDDLQVEWGYGTIEPDYFESDSGHVKRNLPMDQMGDALPVIRFARDAMNSGAPLRKVAASLKARFDHPSLKLASKDLLELFKMDGIIGRIAVDGRDYQNCAEAIEAAKNSPYKRFIKYVIGCSCGDHVLLPAGNGHDLGKVADTTGNAFDDFLGVQEDNYSPEMVSHCRSTMLPILGGQGDLDESEMDATLIDLMNLTGLPVEQAKKLNNKYTKRLDVVKHAFRMVDEKQHAAEMAKYADHVDASQHVIDVVEQEVEVTPERKVDAVDVDPTNHSIQTDITPEAPFKTNFDGPRVLTGDLSHIELAGTPDMSQIDIELMDDQNPNEINLTDRQPLGAIDVDERPGEQQVDIMDFQALDNVELDQFQETEFEGSDMFDLEPIKEAKKELDIDMNQDMTI